MKVQRFLLPLTGLALALGSLGAYADLPAKVTYNDQVLPLFKNACLNCHNPDKKKAGLDLSTYQGALAGSDNGKVLESGNPSGSLLIKCCRQTEDPKMPPKGDKLSDGEIALLEKWIAGQLLESANGKAVVASNHVETAVVSLERPAGPPPMPMADLPLEPLVHTKSSNALVALAASPWAPLVAVGGQKQIILYQTETLQPLGILPFPEGFPEIIRFSRNGQLLMTGGGLGGKSGKVVLWNVQTGERAGEVGNEFDQVLGADLSPDQAHVALGGPGKLLKIYATKDGKLEQSLKKHTDWVTAVAFSPDGKFLASADRSGGIQVWEGVTGHEFITLAGHKAAVTALAFMPGVLASASEDGKITLWDVKEGKEIRSWNGHAGGVSSVDFTPDGRLVSAGRDKLAKAWDQTGKTLLVSEAFDDIALRAVLANDRVIAGDWTGRIRVFKLKDGGKATGELSSNPPLLAESLALAEKGLAEAKAAAAAAQAGLTLAEENLKAALDGVGQKHQQEIETAQVARQQAQVELDAIKADGSAVAASPKELESARGQLAELRKVRDAASGGDRAAAQQKVDAQKAAVAALEQKAAAAGNAPNEKLAAAEKKLQAAISALATAQTTDAKLAVAPDLMVAAEAAAKRLEPLRAEANRLATQRDTHKVGGNEYNRLDGLLNAKRAELTQAEAAAAAAKLAASLPAPELEVRRQRAALEAASADVAALTSACAHWHRAQAFMSVHQARQSVAELQARYEDLVATAKEALAPIAQTEAAKVAAAKTVQETPALLKEKEAGLATVNGAAAQAAKGVADAEALLGDREAKRQAATVAQEKERAASPTATKRLMSAKAALDRPEASPPEGTPEAAAFEAKRKTQQDEFAQAQVASDASNKAVEDCKVLLEKLTAEIANAKETIAAKRLEAKTAAALAIKAEAALVAVRKAGDEAQKRLTDLTQRTEEIAQAARSAKAEAEQESVAVAKQLEAAKTEAARVRANYNAQYGAPEAPQPLAAAS